MNPQITSLPETVGIAGAGLLGRLLAWRLSILGCKVTLFDAGNILDGKKNSAAAFTAAGMIAPLSEAVVSDANVYRMGQYALQKWPEWLSELRPDKKLFFQNGSLVIAHPQDQSELDQFASELKFVIPQCNTYQRIDQQQIQQLEPDLHSLFSNGLFLSEEAHLHNRELLQELTRELIKLGCEFRENTSVDLTAFTIQSTNKSEKFSCVIDCRGTGAKSQVKNLRGVRGETLHVQTSEVHFQRPIRLMHPRYQLYLVPKPDNCFIIGATQIESEDRSPISLQSSLELSSALYTLSPAFSEARIIEMDSNLRPAFHDNLPRIDIQDGIIRANGLFRHGYLLAPAVVDSIMSNLMKAEETVFCHLLNSPSSLHSSSSCESRDPSFRTR
jgi:glycine oxidase